ncbi:MAG: HEAT repeat domain-containing protein [Candidatus Micrarchaeota archaeon]
MNTVAETGTPLRTGAPWVLSTEAIGKLSSNVSKVQLEGAKIIAGNPGMHYLLELLLKHSNPEVRVVTAEELFNVGSSAKVTLGQLLNDKDERVIKAASESLRKIDEMELNKKLNASTRLVSAFHTGTILQGFEPDNGKKKGKIKA